jgi:hypothetical protein
MTFSPYRRAARSVRSVTSCKVGNGRITPDDWSHPHAVAHLAVECPQVPSALYMTAMVQVRRPSAGQAYYQRKLAEGKSAKEALRCLKRRLSDAVYRCLATDQAEQPSDGHQHLRAFSVRHRWMAPAASRP